MFHGIAPCEDGGIDVQLRMARLVADPAVPQEHFRPKRPQAQLTVPWPDFASLTAADVRMGEGDLGPWDDAGGFGTDAAISRSRGAFGRERELQRWAPEAGEEHLMGLEEAAGPVERGWDQFALNEAKFGVRTDFREELYTTELDHRWARRCCAHLPSGGGSGQKGAWVQRPHGWVAAARGLPCVPPPYLAHRRLQQIALQRCGGGAHRP